MQKENEDEKKEDKQGRERGEKCVSNTALRKQKTNQ